MICMSEALFTFTVFPVKLWTPEKIFGMPIVLWPIRCETKPQEVTGKPQQSERLRLVTTLWETMSWLFSSTTNLQFYCFQTLKLFFSVSVKNRYEWYIMEINLSVILNWADRIRHGLTARLRVEKLYSPLNLLSVSVKCCEVL